MTSCSSGVSWTGSSARFSKYLFAGLSSFFIAITEKSPQKFPKKVVFFHVRKPPPLLHFVGHFPPLRPPVAAGRFQENLDGRSFFFFIEFSQNIGDVVQRIGFQRLIGPDGKEWFFSSSFKIRGRREAPRIKNIIIFHPFDGRFGIKAVNLPLDDADEFFRRADIKRNFVVVRRDWRFQARPPRRHI